MNILEEHKIGLTQLTDLFELNKRQYNTSAYDEANTRTDFIRAEGLIPRRLRRNEGFNTPTPTS